MSFEVRSVVLLLNSVGKFIKEEEKYEKEKNDPCSLLNWPVLDLSGLGWKWKKNSGGNYALMNQYYGSSLYHVDIQTEFQVGQHKFTAEYVHWDEGVIIEGRQLNGIQINAWKLSKPDLSDTCGERRFADPLLVDSMGIRHIAVPNVIS